MKIKFLSNSSTGKKMGALLACGALVAAIGVGSASAAATIQSLQVKIDNGVKYYSTDGGKTWSKQPPKGVNTTIDAEGKVTTTNGTPPADGQASLTKVEDGVKSYSTDGGKTWSHEAPEGSNEGAIGGENFPTFTRGTPEGAADLIIKYENGVKLYSTDGGETWSEEAPQGVTETTGENGETIHSYNIAPKAGERGVLTKVEDGVRTYSTDGGKTWSEEAPEDSDGGIASGDDSFPTYTRGTPEGTPDLIIKYENGVKLYSTDGGKTWSQEAPKGVTESTGENGETIHKYGIAPKAGEGGVLTKVEDGVRTYSTDGGKSWSKQAPRADEGTTV
jgi:photosystem II stability/assembly factor-like uncharacterized protein